MASSVFFSGTVPEAIALSKQEKRPLIVFLKGSDTASQNIEVSFCSSEFASIAESCLLLLLEDDLTDNENENFKNAKMFRQLFPADQLPAIYFLGQNGSLILRLMGEITKENLLEKLNQALAEFRPQTLQSRSDASGQATEPENVPTSSSTPSREIVTVDKPTPKEKIVKKKKQEIKKPKQPPVYTTASVRVLLPNEDSIQHEFLADATLGEVFTFVDIHRTDDGGPYVLEMMYPRKTFDQDQFDVTLKDLDLLPRSTLRLTPIKQEGRRGSVSSVQQDPGLFSTLYSGLGSLCSYIGSFSPFGGTEQEHPETRDETGGSDPTESQPSPSELHSVSQDTQTRNIRRRGTWGANVYGFHDRDEDSTDRSRNAFWNGNSTEFGSGKNDHED